MVVFLKGGQRLQKKRETQQVSTPIRIRSRIFLTRHAVTSRYCFAHFQKWKSSGRDDGQAHPDKQTPKFTTHLHPPLIGANQGPTF